MATKTNARTIQGTLEDGLKGDATLLASFGKVVGFAALAASGEPVALAALVEKVLETAGAAVEGASEVARRLGGERPEGAISSLSNFDRFKAVFYTACAKSYIESISAGLPKIALQTFDGWKLSTFTPEEIDPSVREKIKFGIAKLSEAEVSFLYGIEPLSGTVPLFAAYCEWTACTLVSMGVDEHSARSVAGHWEKEARERFKVYLSGTDPIADWMRRYLAIAREDQLGILVEGLAGVAESLRDWTEPQLALKKREEQAWADYRDTLKSLPDLKETMFNEQFGVRKVFVKPEVTYHVAGGVGDAGKPQNTNDIGRLLGALISTRTTGEDLVILCGGPGSGKSTLCRVLAAQLASDPKIHPIFVRLRRLKEGSDIGAFIEESLQKLGAITRLSDLREYPNLVVILDGFDELVMASRARLRQFFNVLREEHSSGALRKAKIIVSGRDTLFPQGDGLPNGSHVVTLLPFDKERVSIWSEKWRAVHADGPGATFSPAKFLEASEGAPRSSPLKHLVSWPLTLHLVARVHTTGLLNLGGDKKAERIEKAYLYRSILAETAQRQECQADTEGRLKPEKMREFLRDLAWHMYAESRDSMDPSEVMPLLGNYFKGTTDAELAELADVAVVNSPELAKGEETGFEFVHKSFSEYLVAERMALSIEHAIFRAPMFGADELSWRMSDEDASRELAPYLGTRLLTEEVQEMLEPMLGSFLPFLKGARVNEVVSAKAREIGLKSVISRLEGLLRHCVSGEHFDVAVSTVRRRQAELNPLEIFSNYSAGVVLLGVAAAKQLRSENRKASKEICFEANYTEGAFWRWLSIMNAGGLQLDRKLAARLFDGLSVQAVDGRNVEDRSSPLKLGLLSSVRGYHSTVSDAVGDLLTQLHQMQLYLLVVSTYHSVIDRVESNALRQSEVDSKKLSRISLREVSDLGHLSGLDSFVQAGVLSEYVDRRVGPPIDYFMHMLSRSKSPKETAEIIDQLFHTLDFGYGRQARTQSPALFEMIRWIASADPKALVSIEAGLRRFR